MGPYETVLERGYAMASVYPAVHYHDRSTPLTDGLRKTLNGCKNPLGSPLGSAVSEWPSLSTVGFVKFGGEPWRASFFSDAYAACPSNPDPNPNAACPSNPDPNPNAACPSNPGPNPNAGCPSNPSPNPNPDPDPNPDPEP